MISELKIRNFKSLESVDLKLGHFNLLVGANASGKSNFLDALRFLQGVGNGFTLNEILDGKPPSSTNAKWDGIRGGSKFVSFRKQDGTQSESNQIHVTFDDIGITYYGLDKLTYGLTWAVKDGVISISSEILKSDSGNILMDEMTPYLVPLPDEEFDVSSNLDVSFDSPLRVVSIYDAWPRVTFWSHSEYPSEMVARCARFVSSELADMQLLDLLPAMLRDYSSKVARLGELGEGFAALIHHIETNGSKPALLEWLKELRPDEVSDLFAIPVSAPPPPSRQSRRDAAQLQPRSTADVSNPMRRSCHDGWRGQQRFSRPLSYIAQSTRRDTSSAASTVRKVLYTRNVMAARNAACGTGTAAAHRRRRSWRTSHRPPARTAGSSAPRCRISRPGTIPALRTAKANPMSADKAHRQPDRESARAWERHSTFRPR